MDKTLEGKFWRFALPSMLAQLLNSFFIIVDGYFIGQNLGDTGLAAINVAWPMVALIQAISMAIGIGGAVRMAMDVGREDMDSAMKECSHAVLMLLITTLILGLGFFLSYPYILPFLGANEELYPLTSQYIRVVCVCAACQVLSTGLLPLLRGQGRTMAAMALTILGLLGNICLDWTFIYRFQMGMRGVALATAISQGLSAGICFILLVTNKKWPVKLRGLKIELRRVREILHYGISPFGLTISTSILIMLTNLQALRYGDTEGVAVYAVLSYILGSVIPLVSGVGDGIQPLLSNAYGAGNWTAVAKLRRKGLSLAVGASLLCSLLCFLFKAQLPELFGASASAAEKCMNAMWTLCLAFPFMAAVRFLCSYFCALGMPKASSILAYCEPLAAQPLFLYLTPLLFKLEGVWLSYPLAVILMTAAALLLLKGHRRKTIEDYD